MPPPMRQHLSAGMLATRLHYYQMYIPKAVERILKTAPPGGT